MSKLNEILTALDDSTGSFEFTPEVLRELTGPEMDTLLAALRFRRFSSFWCQGLLGDWLVANQDKFIVPIQDNYDQGMELAILSRQEHKYEGQ